MTLVQFSNNGHMSSRIWRDSKFIEKSISIVAPKYLKSEWEELKLYFECSINIIMIGQWLFYIVINNSNQLYLGRTYFIINTYSSVLALNLFNEIAELQLPKTNKNLDKKK